MDKLYKPSYLKEVLEDYGFGFSKALGQNFLVDGNIVRTIVRGSGVEEDDLVIEIGPGAGTLTNELAEIAAKVIAIELDKKLIPILEHTTNKEKVELIHQDALEVDFHELVRSNPGYKSVRLIANLPYNVGTTIVARMLEDKVPLDSMTIMLQKEVADRMLAKVGDKNFGSISLLVAYNTKGAELIATAPKTVFMPQPKVDSQVIRLDIKKTQPRAYERLMFEIIRGAFTQRRKTILNSLTVGSGLSKADLAKVLEDLGLDPKLRAEDLGIEDFENIARLINEKGLDRNH